MLFCFWLVKFLINHSNLIVDGVHLAVDNAWENVLINGYICGRGSREVHDSVTIEKLKFLTIWDSIQQNHPSG